MKLFKKIAMCGCVLFLTSVNFITPMEHDANMRKKLEHIRKEHKNLIDQLLSIPKVADLFLYQIIENHTINLSYCKIAPIVLDRILTLISNFLPNVETMDLRSCELQRLPKTLYVNKKLLPKISTLTLVGNDFSAEEKEKITNRFPKATIWF